MDKLKQRLHKAILHVSGEVNENTLEMINFMAEKASSLTYEQNRCEYCRLPNGIHAMDCSFMNKIPTK